MLNCLKICRGPIYWDPKNKILVVQQLTLLKYSKFQYPAGLYSWSKFDPYNVFSRAIKATLR